MRSVLLARTWRSDVRDATPVRTPEELMGGRLLVYWPDEELSDGAAEEETRGFFDVNNAPAWDTWVALFGEDETSAESEYVVSWVSGGVR